MHCKTNNTYSNRGEFRKRSKTFRQTHGTECILCIRQTRWDRVTSNSISFLTRGHCIRFLGLVHRPCQDTNPSGKCRDQICISQTNCHLAARRKQMLVRVGVCKLTYNQNMFSVALCVVTKITGQTFALGRHTDNEIEWNIWPKKVLVRRTQRQVTYTQPENEEICYISQTGERRLCYRLITFISSYQVKSSGHHDCYTIYISCFIVHSTEFLCIVIFKLEANYIPDSAA